MEVGSNMNAELVEQLLGAGYSASCVPVVPRRGQSGPLATPDGFTCQTRLKGEPRLTFALFNNIILAKA